MRIAQVAPLWERVPPPAYGGIELVTSLLTEELVRRGHEVTLFASGDSVTEAQLESVHPCAIRLDDSVQDYAVYETLQLNQVYQRADEFDMIHFHMGYAALSYASFIKTPTIHTLHGNFTADNRKLFQQAKQQNFVSISDAQRSPLPELNYVATIYNGIALDQHPFQSQPTEPPYLAFLGRVSPEKGVHHAIEIAQKSGWRLRMAGKVDQVDVDYFESQIRPHIDGEQIEFLGEADQDQKNKLLGGATAVLFPITWQEPFGLVMVEAMAMGTPVIAIALGSAPEVVAAGKTGFLCQNVDECIHAIARIPQLSRQACREHVVERFSTKRMTDDYEAVYRQIMKQQAAQNGRVRQQTALRQTNIA